MVEVPFYKSAEFWTTLVGMAVIALSSLIPEFRSQLDIIAPALVTIIVGVLAKGAVVQTQALRVQAARYQASKATTEKSGIDGRP